MSTAVLNFVGGKNIIIPSEKANKKDAANICGTKGLELISFESLTQLDAVQDFMGDIGICNFNLKHIICDAHLLPSF